MQNALTRCCCADLRKALIFVLYIDMSRIVWGLIICAFLFQQSSSLSLVITIADIVAIVLQASIALYINMRVLQQNNIRPIILYRKFKGLQIFLNILDRLVVPIFNCTLIYNQGMKEQHDQYCEIGVFIALILTAVVWNIGECYFYRIVNAYTRENRRGFIV